MSIDESEYADLISPGGGSIFGVAATEEALGDLGFEGSPTAVSGLGSYGAFGDDEAPAPAPSAPAPVPKAAATTNGSLGAAISLFVIAAGGVGGYKFKGAKGALGGVLASAGARNLWKSRSGGLQQGIIGLAGVGAGLYLLLSKE